MREAVRQLGRNWTDDQLFAVLQGGGEGDGPDRNEALELLFDRYHARVFAQCERLLADAAAAEDATQEIFLSLLQRPLAYEGRQHFGSWLYIVTRNHCLNQLRRRSREVRAEDPGEAWSDLLVDPSDPAREVQDEELAGLVDRTCGEVLTLREREVVHLRYFWGMRVKQINEVLQLTNVSGARSHLATAHRKLRKALQGHLRGSVLDSLFAED